MTDTRPANPFLAWSIVVLPILYSLGFVAWSTYFLRYDLGFHALPAARYLMVGLLFATLFGPLVALEVWYQRNGWLRRTSVAQVELNASMKALGLQAILSLGRLAVFLLTFQFLGIFYSGMEILQASHIQLLVLGALIGFAYAIACLLPHMIQLFTRPFLKFFHGLIDRFGPDKEIDARVVSLIAKIGRSMELGTPFLFLLLISSFSFGFLLIDRIAPEYGGATTKEARLALHPTELPEELRPILEPDYDENGTAWTTPLRPLLVTETEILFRYSTENSTRLVELPRTHVLAIEWR